jgi:hypothetical protein
LCLVFPCAIHLNVGGGGCGCWLICLPPYASQSWLAMASLPGCDNVHLDTNGQCGGVELQGVPHNDLNQVILCPEWARCGAMQYAGWQECMGAGAGAGGHGK